MANIKFSDFTANATIDQADHFLVGFDSDGGGPNPKNNKWTFPQIAAGLAAVTATPYSIYAADGALSGNRDVDLATNNLSFTNGEVGIGTTTFTSVGTGISGLEISNSTSGSILLRDNTSSHVSYWYNHGTGTYFGTKTNDKLNILQNDTVRMNISTDGNLAIGQTTTAANARLHVKGAGATFATTSLLVENSDGSDLINVRDSGRIAIGLGASNSNDDNVVFGNNASAVGTTNNCVVIGTNSNITGSTNAVAIGGGTLTSLSNSSIAIGPAYINGTEAIAIGNSSRSNLGAVSIGHDSGAENNTGSYNLCLGTRAKNTNNANNVIVLNATGSTTATSGTTDDTFSVFMTSNISPDFKVVGGGESIFNTSVKITGQAYTEQHGAPLAGATIDWDNGNVQYIQLASGANALSLSNPKSGATYILQVKQPSSGAAGTITYPTSVKYPGGTKAVLTTDNDAIDIITLIYNGTTTHYYASATLDLK